MGHVTHIKRRQILKASGRADQRSVLSAPKMSDSITRCSSLRLCHVRDTVYYNRIPHSKCFLSTIFELKYSLARQDKVHVDRVCRMRATRRKIARRGGRRSAVFARDTIGWNSPRQNPRSTRRRNPNPSTTSTFGGVSPTPEAVRRADRPQFLEERRSDRQSPVPSNLAEHPPPTSAEIDVRQPQ